MTIELRTIVAAAITLLVLFLVGEGNHYLSPLNTHLYVAGLLITFPILRFSYRQGFVFIVLIALFYDSAAATPFGISLILFLLAHTVIYSLRSRFPREETSAALAVALLINGSLFLALALIQSTDNPAPAVYWRRAIADLFLSQIVVIILAGWFFSLQIEALRYFGIHLENEQRQAE